MLGPFVALQLRLVCRSLKETVHHFSPSLAAFPTPGHDFLAFLQLPAGLVTLRAARAIEFAFWPIRGIPRPQVYSSKLGLLQMEAIQSMIKDKDLAPLAIDALKACFEADQLGALFHKHTGHRELPTLTMGAGYAISILFGNSRDTPANRAHFLVYKTLRAIKNTWLSKAEVNAILFYAIRSLDLALLAEVLSAEGCFPAGKMFPPDEVSRTPLGYACVRCPDPDRRKVLSLLVDRLARGSLSMPQVVETVVDDFFSTWSTEQARTFCKQWEAKFDYVSDALRAADFSSPVGLFFWLLGYMRHHLDIPELADLNSRAFWNAAHADCNINHATKFPDCIARRAIKVFGIKRALSYVVRGLSAGHTVSLKRVAEEELDEPEAKRPRTEATIVLD